MGNPTAAQEPSMEEILASIRQIISEDGEAQDTEGDAEASADQVETAEQPDEDGPADVPETEAKADEAPVDDVDDADDGGFDLSEEAAADPEPSLSDIAAGTREDHEESDEQAVSYDTMKSESGSEDEDDDDLVDTGPYESPFDKFNEKASAAENEQAAHNEPAVTEPEPDTEPTQQVEQSEPAPMPAADDQLNQIAAASDHGAAVQSTEIQSSEPHPEISESQAMTATAPQPAEISSDDKLISPDASASVANAFSSLTHTILSQNARTLDDLVSDMLQPMLKEWLDENLPTLVERLVKQEIDRMARGGRA